MPETALATPLVTVRLADGQVLTVRVLNPDYLAWDRTAAKHGWPSMSKAPFTWLTFVAWAALRREGRIEAGLTWEAFSEREAVEVRTAGDAQANGKATLEALGDLVPGLEIGVDTETDAAVPTPPGPEPG